MSRSLGHGLRLVDCLTYGRITALVRGSANAGAVAGSQPEELSRGSSRPAAEGGRVSNRARLASARAQDSKMVSARHAGRRPRTASRPALAQEAAGA